MTKSISKQIGDKEALWLFRAKLLKLYEEFEAKVETLCQQHDISINFWYSPSNIPQPKFRIGKVMLDADTLYSEDEFSLLFSPEVPWSKKVIKRSPHQIR